MKNSLANIFKKNNIWQTALGLIKQIFIYIYEFIFIWEDEPFQETDLIENEKRKHSLIKGSVNSLSESIVHENSTVTIKSTISQKNEQEYESIKNVLGKQTADYIVKLRQEADYVIKEHSLIQENSMVVVLSPEKINECILNPEFFEITLERIYSQYNEDVIFKPANIKIINTATGSFYAEIKIETYAVTQELLASV